MMMRAQLSQVKLKRQALTLLDVLSSFNWHLVALLLLHRYTLCIWGAMALGFRIAMLAGLTLAVLLEENMTHLSNRDFFFTNLLIAAVVTDGLVNHVAPGFFLTVLMIFSMTLFVVDGIALLHPLRFRYWHLDFTTLLAVNFLGLSYHGDWHGFANLKKGTFWLSPTRTIYRSS